MRAFILAAGLGTRLRPFTLEHPKALVPVGGVPMLQRVLERLRSEGFGEVIINVHHFADQIERYLVANDNFGMKVEISDERARLLDTGGALLHAAPLIGEGAEPLLVHNVDILSDAPLRRLMERHEESRAMATLLVSRRDSSRRLAFDAHSRLRGWVNITDGSTKPAGFSPAPADTLLAFSGIHVVTPSRIYPEMLRQQREGKFSVIDFYLQAAAREDDGGSEVRGYVVENLHLIDIGKPDTLRQAEEKLTGVTDGDNCRHGWR